MKGELNQNENVVGEMARIFWAAAAPRDAESAALAQLLPGSSVHWGNFNALPAASEIIIVELPHAGRPVEVLETVARKSPGARLICWNPMGSVSEAVDLVRRGAFHYMAHPEQLPLEELANWIRTALNDLSSEESARKVTSSTGRAGLLVPARTEAWRQLLVGESIAMQQLAANVRLLALRRSTVLINGETGTGKEMLARALHTASPRGLLPMVSVNCTALPDTLLESELFGHTKGAFTGAVTSRMGRFEQAHKSSIFLDEIGDMPLETQAKLLRVLQEKEIQKLGSTEVLKVDVRVIAATNVDLEAKVEQGKFREDLFYRLNVVPIRVPPLRERLEDIALLVDHFLEKIAKQEEMNLKYVAPGTITHLMSHHWPGNIRQLENAVDRAITLSGERDSLYPEDFPLPAGAAKDAGSDLETDVELPASGVDFESIVNRLERTLIDQALRRAHGNKKQAADILGLKRTTLSAKLKSLEAAAS